MSSPTPAKQKDSESATKPRQKIQGHTGHVRGVLRLPGEWRIVTCSEDGSLRVWDLKSGTQVGEAWRDKGSEEMFAIALSPDGTTVASGSEDGAVRLWGIDTGKVIKKWTGHTKEVKSICWSPDGERVVSGSEDGTLRVWSVKSGETMLGPIKAGGVAGVFAVCFSPDGTMIATGGVGLKVWDANTGELLKTLEGGIFCLSWTSDGKILFAGLYHQITKYDTATWTEISTFEAHGGIQGISLSPNGRILVSASSDQTMQLWNLDDDQPIGPFLYHERSVTGVTFYADGKFLAITCDDHHIYTWDVSAIVREADLEDLLSDNVNTVKKSSNVNADSTRQRAPKIEGARRIPPAFFDDFSTSRDHHTAAPSQTTRLGRLPSHNPLSWAQNFVSGILRRQHGSDRLHVPPIVEVPLTAGKPRDYYARKKKPSASSSRPPNSHTTAQQQGGGATQNNLLSSQQPPAIATPSTPAPTVAGTTGAASTISPPDITIQRAGWRARFLLWICCVPIQNTAGQHLGSNI